MTNSADSDQLATDLDLHCLQSQGISGFSRTRVNIVTELLKCLFLSFSALFDAVEHQDLDAVKEILETNGLDINRYYTSPLPLTRQHQITVLTLIIGQDRPKQTVQI